MRGRGRHADTNCDTPLVKYYLRRQHVVANVPSREREHRGRPRKFDRDALRKIRYTVERFFVWVKSFRRVDSRYDRRASSFMEFIHIACNFILMREILRYPCETAKSLSLKITLIHQRKGYASYPYEALFSPSLSQPSGTLSRDTLHIGSRGQRSLNLKRATHLLTMTVFSLLLQHPVDYLQELCGGRCNRFGVTLLPPQPAVEECEVALRLLSDVDPGALVENPP